MGKQEKGREGGGRAEKEKKQCYVKEWLPNILYGIHQNTNNYSTFTKKYNQFQTRPKKEKKGGKKQKQWYNQYV